MVGLVRAGLELGAQIRDGLLPEPERVYVALGTGGTAVGLSVGLALAGVRSTVTAVAVVEPVLSRPSRLDALRGALLAELHRFGLEAPRSGVRLSVDRSHLGRGYAKPTREAVEACVRFQSLGIRLEPVYTGKAVAAILKDARCLGLRRVLYWHTLRRTSLPVDPGFRERLPRPLRDRLEAANAEPTLVTRRRVLSAVLAAGTVGAIARVTGYNPIPGFHGEVLSLWEANVVLAAAEVLLPLDAAPAELAEVPQRADRFLVALSPSMQRDVHSLLAIVEHGPLGLRRRVARFTHLSRRDREGYLTYLAAGGGLLRAVYRGLRDLTMVAYYQQASTFRAIGYGGPLQPPSDGRRGAGRPSWPAYDRLVAAPGVLPKGAHE
jgi:D-cysteine desulfhydrase